MKLFYFSFILICLTLCGCSSLFSSDAHTVYQTERHAKIWPIYIDRSFTKAEVDSLVVAINEWNYTLNGYVRLEIQKQFIDHTDEAAMTVLEDGMKDKMEGLVIFGMNHDNPFLAGTIEPEDGCVAFVRGLGDRAHVMVVLQDRYGHRDLNSVLLHELGHALGADHVKAPSLMYPYIGKYQLTCIDKITAAVVAHYQEIPLEHLNYCSTPNFE